MNNPYITNSPQWTIFLKKKEALESVASFTKDAKALLDKAADFQKKADQYTEALIKLGV